MRVVRPSLGGWSFFVLLAASSAWVAPGRGLRPAMAEPPNDPLAASDV